MLLVDSAAQWWIEFRDLYCNI